MKRFFVYCNANQAYEALTYNDIMCSSMKGNSFRVATLSFLSNSFVFLSGEKINEAGRNYGISEQDNQYPVVFQISGTENYNISARFLTINESGNYEISKDFLPLSSYCDIDNCIGAFVYGYIPFSLVSKVIFENEENKNRFHKSGSELWFPTDKFTEWDSPEFAYIPKRSINTSSLREISINLDKEIEQKKVHLDYLVQLRAHVKTAAYLAIEATEKWKIGKLETNVDSAIIHKMDNQNKTLMSAAVNKLDEIADVLTLANPEAFESIDRALDDESSVDFYLLKTILSEIADNSFKLDKETLIKIKEKIDSPEAGISMLDAESCSMLFDSICTFANARIGKSEQMLSATKDEVILYALALCYKNKGKIDLVKLETAEMTQDVRRYAYIISGLAANMASISGDKKSDAVLEKRLSDIVSTTYIDDDGILISLREDQCNEIGITPHIRLNVTSEEFKDHLIETAPPESLKALYESEMKDLISEKDISSFKNPIVIMMDGKNYTITDFNEADKFIKDFNKKKNKRKLEFNRDLFISKVLENHEFDNEINSIYEKFCQ